MVSWVKIIQHKLIRHLIKVKNCAVATNSKVIKKELLSLQNLALRVYVCMCVGRVGGYGRERRKFHLNCALKDNLLKNVKQSVK